MDNQRLHIVGDEVGDSGLQQPLDIEEHEYFACLLVTGPPNVLAQPVVDRTPVSSLEYMHECALWYNTNVRGREWGYIHTYSFDQPNDFDGWWRRYKTWLLEAYRHD